MDILEEALAAYPWPEEAAALLAQARREAADEVLVLLRGLCKAALLDALPEAMGWRASPSTAVSAAAGACYPGAASGPEPAPAGAEALGADAASHAALAGDLGAAAGPDLGSGSSAASGAAADGDPAPAPAVEAAGDPDADALRREVEAIRRRLAENERFLAGGPAGAATSLAEGEAVAEPATAEPEADSADEAAAAADAAPEIGWYVYGVVREPASGTLVVGACGVDPTTPVEVLATDGLAAVVSQVSLEEFGEDGLESNLRDPEWAEERVRAHHGVLNELAAAGLSPVALRFCTIFQETDRVLEMLRDHRTALLTALDRVAKKAEWGVKLFCDGEAARRSVSGQADAPEAIRGELESAGSGAAYFLRKRLDKVLDAEVERITDEAAQSVHDALSRAAADSVVLSLQDRDVTGRSETMLLNGAYLVQEDALGCFEAAVELMVQEVAPLGCSLELTGPWPAYNFAEVGEDEVVNG